MVYTNEEKQDMLSVFFCQSNQNTAIVSTRYFQVASIISCCSIMEP